MQQTRIQKFFFIKAVGNAKTHAIEAKSIIEERKGKLKEIEKLENNVNFNSYIVRAY